MGFYAASSAAGGRWLSKALYGGDWGKVSGIVPSGFEAYVAIRHPAWRCDCTSKNLSDLRAGHEIGHPIHWALVAESDVPVLYGYALYSERGITRHRGTQYRRLPSGGWILDELPVSLLMSILPGDAWVAGPREGSLEPDLARVIQGVLARQSVDSEPCWFGIWEGFGYLTEAQLAAPTIAAPGRRWHLFRAPLDHLARSFAGGRFEHQPANLVWPADRTWCLATEIDAEATYVGGSTALISAILDEPDLEAVAAFPHERVARLGEVLSPVVDKPAGASLRPGFESRE